MESVLDETQTKQQQHSATPTTTPTTPATTTIPTLQIFSFPPLKSPQQLSGNLTSPLHTCASVPFSWEEQPGKPLPCLTLALPSNNNNNNNTIKCLELPPRLLNEAKFTKTPSPTTVLEGPYSYNINSNGNLSSFVGKSSSFRFLRKKQGSFDGLSALSLGGSRGSSPERGLLGGMVLSRSDSCKRDKGLFGSWRKRGGVPFKGSKSKNEAHHGGNFVFPSSLSDDGGGGGGGGATTTSSCDGGRATVKVTRTSRKGNFLGLSSPNKSHFWAAIYGAFKQVIPSPRRSAKWKKDAW